MSDETIRESGIGEAIKKADSGIEENPQRQSQTQECPADEREVVPETPDATIVIQGDTVGHCDEGSAIGCRADSIPTTDVPNYVHSSLMKFCVRGATILRMNSDSDLQKAGRTAEDTSDEANSGIIDTTTESTTDASDSSSTQSSPSHSITEAEVVSCAEDVANPPETSKVADVVNASLSDASSDKVDKVKNKVLPTQKTVPPEKQQSIADMIQVAKKMGLVKKPAAGHADDATKRAKEERAAHLYGLIFRLFPYDKKYSIRE
jgi:hypothetical protein